MKSAVLEGVNERGQKRYFIYYNKIILRVLLYHSTHRHKCYANSCYRDFLKSVHPEFKPKMTKLQSQLEQTIQQDISSFSTARIWPQSAHC